MNAVGIDVSKGKSTVAIMRPFGEVVVSPFEVNHNAAELGQLAERIKGLEGETRIVMEVTGSYSQPVARFFHEAGLFVSAVHPLLVHGFGNNSIRKVKTDQADAVKIAAYALSNWLKLPRYVPEEDTRQMLKTYSRQYDKYVKLKTALKNNLIFLVDQTFPGVNTLFSPHSRKSNGHEKWIDFVADFWHCGCVCGLSLKAFTSAYRRWCKRAGYYFDEAKAGEVYDAAHGHVSVMPKSDTAETLVKQAVAQINTVGETLAAVAREMNQMAASLSEYPAVMEMRGAGEILGPQLMAEVGDVCRFRSKGSIVCFAGLDAPPFKSGQFESHNRHISKKGSPHLRKTLFQIVDGLIKSAPADDPVFQFIDRKRAENKPYYVYMTAGAAKFLRIYYGRVKEYLDKQNAGI